MATLRKNYLVKKRNVLNEIRANNMTLQELRFFSIYLSRINAKDVSTRVVQFSLSDFQAIMELNSRLKIDDMKRVTNSLLGKIVNLRTERGGYVGFQLFKKCKVEMDNTGDWYVEIDAHDDSLPLLFEFQSRFFSYQLWNALSLRSSNQLRMYEILKQYEKIGARVLEVDTLKELLGIGRNEYPRFNNFKSRVLDACQQALQESTDLKFTYEPYGKKGKGGKVLALKFTIEKNADYTDQLTLAEFIEERRLEALADDNISDDWFVQPEGTEYGDMTEAYREKITFLAEACCNEFTFSEIVVLFNEMRSRLPYELIRDNIQCYDYLSDKYSEMIMRNEKVRIKHRFSYLRSMIGKEYDA